MCWNQVSKEVIPFVDEQIFVRQLKEMAENQLTLTGAIYSAMPQVDPTGDKMASQNEIALELNVNKLTPVDPVENNKEK